MKHIIGVFVVIVVSVLNGCVGSDTRDIDLDLMPFNCSGGISGQSVLVRVEGRDDMGDCVIDQRCIQADFDGNSFDDLKTLLRRLDTPILDVPAQGATRVSVALSSISTCSLGVLESACGTSSLPDSGTVAVSVDCNTEDTARCPVLRTCEAGK